MGANEKLGAAMHGADLSEAYAVIRNLVDPDDCWYDHHGGCQAHGFLSLEHNEVCPHTKAKQWLAINNELLGES